MRKVHDEIDELAKWNTGTNLYTMLAIVNRKAIARVNRWLSDGQSPQALDQCSQKCVFYRSPISKVMCEQSAAQMTTLFELYRGNFHTDYYTKPIKGL